jgi:hypothetical protein
MKEHLFLNPAGASSAEEFKTLFRGVDLLLQIHKSEIDFANTSTPQHLNTSTPQQPPMAKEPQVTTPACAQRQPASRANHRAGNAILLPRFTCWGATEQKTQLSRRL